MINFVFTEKYFSDMNSFESTQVRNQRRVSLLNVKIMHCIFTYANGMYS